LLIAAVVCLPWLARLPGFEFEAETRVLLGGDQRNLASYEQVREILGDTEAVVVSLELEDLFSPSGLDVVRRVSDAFAAQPGVVGVHSLTHAVRPVRRGLTFEMVPLVSAGATGAELAELRNFCLTHPLVRNLLVAADGRHTLVTVTFGRRAVTAADRRALGAVLTATLAPFRAQGVRARVLALPLIEEELRATLARDLRRFVPVAGAVVLGVLGFTFRSWRLVLFVLANQAFALALLPGLAAATGARLTVFTLLLVPLLSGLHLTLLAHLLTARQRNLAAGQSPAAALAEAVRLTWKPSSFATLTTVAGLLSLATSGLAPIRTFGLLGAAGLLVIHLLTYGPTLALLALTDRPQPELPPPPRADACGAPPGPAGWVAFTAQWRRAILATAGGALLLAVAGLTQLRTDIRAVEFLSPASPTRQALEELDQVWGGINVVAIAFDTGRAGGANDPGFLRYLESVHRHAEGLRDLAGAYSYARLLAMINQVWEGGSSEALRLPANPLLTRLFVVALKSYEFPFLKGLTDADFRTAQLVLRTRDLPATRYLALVNDVLAFAERERPSAVTVSAAAGIHSLLDADRQIRRSLLRSAGLTVVVIFATLALLWRSWRLPLLALGINLLPVSLVIALAAWAALPLNSITVMVAAVSLGIAVDDSIHFLTHWRERRQAGAPPATALRETLALKGRTLVWTSLILIAVCLVFWCSSFPPVRDFGLLSAAAFAAALAAVLMLLPALLHRPGGREVPAR
jgi:hypothetical protein